MNGHVQAVIAGLDSTVKKLRREADTIESFASLLRATADNTDSVKDMPDTVRKVWLDLKPGDKIVRVVNEGTFEIARAATTD